GANEFVIGNVVGSNIINIALILGIGALIMPLEAHISLLKRESPLLLIVTVLCVVALLDGVLSRWEGALALAGGTGYTIYLIVISLRERRADVRPEEVVGKVPPGQRWWALLLVAMVSLAVMIYGADLFVNGAIVLSERFGASPLVIGITVIAVGTSLPELVTTVIAAVKKEQDIAIGTVMGSNIFNILVVLGLTACLRPVVIGDGNEALWVDLAVMTGVTVSFVAMIFSKDNRITRPYGATLLGVYILYTVYLLWQPA
ncbi:MAG TPA: sodium:calcium antiporter, partial [candidate division Zixibacteria bacterium]|nr:sodium:calcium antiporter [candidate division Zixibacteria bacterium]